MTKSELIRKYNVAGPRYTSYPTVPFWTDSPTQEQWLNCVNQQMKGDRSISLYIHLPFCESLCTYCGCNTRITVNHAVEGPYISALLKEWKMYVDKMDFTPLIKEIHLGGGTPTFFSAENLDRLMSGIFELAEKAEDIECSFEAHPQNTTEDHLKLLYDWGFRRISFGIQDFDPEVQRIINRKQSFEKIRDITNASREIGFTSINYDLIYGLPRQTKASVIDTIEKVKILNPDRIAFYSYAHVPWIKPGQRSFTEKDLPQGIEKSILYEEGKALLEEKGYVEIGMDHFALKSDSLFDAMQTGNLHRNFMGYTSGRNQLLIGLGVSSISDSWTAFAQNVKTIEQYYKLLEENSFPIFKGHLLNDEDLIIRKHILNIMCNFETDWENPASQFVELEQVIMALQELEKDGLVVLSPFHLKVTEKGRAFLRNICMAFDLRLLRKQPATTLFSTTV
ncbi:MAG: oxygen-independent coproporphyrinogen III oxidase [Bacteroidetes bacterium]|nr:oxygen-independent coproporphyrinogen III oxidase [Bacteroidota bacterium]MBP9791279.1 oxygen-independent coproporphyrinogen III oxidase [Bacteroidia bacterium]